MSPDATTFLVGASLLAELRETKFRTNPASSSHHLASPYDQVTYDLVYSSIGVKQTASLPVASTGHVQL